MAHEVNNPANLLLANLQELQRAFSELLPVPHPRDSLVLPQEELRCIHELHSILADAREGAQRIVEVVRDLVQLSHQEAAPAEPVELNRLIETVLRLTRPVLGGTRIQRSLGVIPTILAQRPRIFQVLLNLLINAVHAVSEVEVSRRSILVRTQEESLRSQAGVTL